MTIAPKAVMMWQTLKGVSLNTASDPCFQLVCYKDRDDAIPTSMLSGGYVTQSHNY